MYSREKDVERPLLGLRVANLTEEEAYEDWWGRHYKFKEADVRINEFLSVETESFKGETYGWLKAARQALHISTNEMADRLAVSTASYCKLERAEMLRNIRLRSLIEAAEVMNCELVYAIRPKAKMSFSRVIWNQIFPIANNLKQFRNRAFSARIVVEDKSVRELFKWNRRSRVSEYGIFRLINRQMLEKILKNSDRKP